MQSQTVAAYGRPWAAKRKSHFQDIDQKQKYSKTDINYIIRPQTSPYEIPNVKETVAPPRDELTEEVAGALLSLHSAANPRAGKDNVSTSKVKQPMPGPCSRGPSVYNAPHWKKSRHARFFEMKYGDVPKPSDTDWTVPQRKQDGQGREYFWSGKMKGKRKVWTREYPRWLMCPPPGWLEEEAVEEMIERSLFEHELFNKRNNTVSENETIGGDVSRDEDSEQPAGTADTGYVISDGLERQRIVTGDFWVD